MSAFTRAVVAATAASPVEKLITETRAGRALAERFVAGDTVEAGIEAARRLNAQRLLVSLDLLGEEVHDRAGAGGPPTVRGDTAGDRLRGNLRQHLHQAHPVGAGHRTGPGRSGRRPPGERRPTPAPPSPSTWKARRTRKPPFASTRRPRPNTGTWASPSGGTASDARRPRAPASLGGHIRLVKAPTSTAVRRLADRPEIVAAFVRLLTCSCRRRMCALPSPPTTRPSSRSPGPRRKRREPFEFQMLYGVRPDERGGWR